MLTAAELIGMRTELAASLPDTAQILRRTLTPDGMGGFVESWTIAGTAVCRVSPSGRQDERIIAERASAVSAWTITLPYQTEVQTTDRIVVGTRTFGVIGIIARSEEIARRVVCVEVT